MRDWQFYREMPVYAENGGALGRVEEVGHGVDFLHVRQGNLLIRDWYVPMDAVADVTVAGVRLRVSAEDMKKNGWNVPPAQFLERQGMTPGYEYTSAADMPDAGTQPRESPPDGSSAGMAVTAETQRGE